MNSVAPMFLTPDEVQKLTGLVQPAAQVRFLRYELGIVEAFKNRAGEVIVLRSKLESTDHQAPAANVAMPDKNALDQI